MLKIIGHVLSIISVLLATYGLITKNFEFNSIMLFFLGLSIFFMGLEEFQEKKKTNGWLLVIVSLFPLFVSAQEFLI
ncbi:DUF3953 domain-containing protein [Priestia endophytica]|uniref:DUF3953 domain-containing protein n=1 Tax=Priestia endophytica TaxID=135735 RepID=UPI000F533535|nr:DUF3953 domain-containing protein [Priestia endophytica]